MPEEELHSIRIHLDRLLVERGMTLTELSAQVGITVVNLSVLKNGRAKAIRFSTLSRICDILGCQPGDLITHEPAGPAEPAQ
ncbi:helix-turn-helix transcriptional regulator [Streptomyces sp. NBC_01260]|uniref:helix-turn-helix domain-containing protein n=1 Tax=unclassified Streptomyces TaxID=2593676 RepID=UPI000F4A3A72|nr:MULTISPECIES: helix-turn-helix transcriptional regulator [unclassified Streptomyces]MCX4771449.1 helix-turn-helix transcriptional regulator [Streptomyces sp. NBC_01285]ROQ81206.1 putative transcriptional regulator [Streptomyces sp. CEV 2-1]RPK48049.1 Helix-turn-helix protein [Streptomyces sp. ADI92-24]